jgi:glycosyltransferase involved in cell wall biosynthesis
MRKVLLISYVFPPGGGAGVQRAVKFAKYLPGWGWQAVVVTAKAKSVPLKDGSLARDLPAGLPLYRLPTFEPPVGGTGLGPRAKASGLALVKQQVRNLLFPDRHILWLPTALPGALAAARRHRVEAVLVTAPPFSTLYLGSMVARILRLPLVLDFRDDWAGLYTHSYGIQSGGRIWRKLVTRCERGLVRKASLVIGNTPALTRRLQEDNGGPARFACLTNGYDQEDFAGLEPSTPPELPPGRLHLLYTGTVFEGSPLSFFWEAVSRLEVEQRKRLWVEVVGRVVPGQTADPRLPGLEVMVRPYEPHQKVLARMKGAGALLLTLGVQAAENRLVPAKFYEYLASRRPILALVPPDQQAGQFVRAHAAGEVVPPQDPARIAGVLARWLDEPPPKGPAPPLKFERNYQAGKLAELLYGIAAPGAKGQGVRQ